MGDHKVAGLEGAFRAVNIIVFAAYFPPVVGGYATNVFALYKRLVAKGHSVAVVTCNTNGGDEVDCLAGVRVYRLPSWNMLGGTYPVPKVCRRNIRIWRELSRMEWDVVNTQTRFFITSLMGWWFAQWNGVRLLVHTERGTCHSVVANPIVALIASIYDHILGAMVVSGADYCVGVSGEACRFAGHLGARAIHRIPNGIEDGVFKARKQDKRRIVSFVGRLIYAKGLQDLISALPIIRERYPDVEVIAAGGGNYRTQLEKLADGMPVEFLGELSLEGVVSLLRKSSVFVNPSYSEGLPTSVMEAAATGLPIVATDVGGTAEIIENKKRGLLVEPGKPQQIADAVLFMMDKPEAAAAYGEAARIRVSSYKWSEVVTDYEALFEKVQRES